MTDKEIIQALECCISAESCCVCGYTKMCDGTTIHQFALDLINRQQKQLDNYSHNVRNMAKDFIDQQKIIQEQQAEIKELKKEKHRLQKALNQAEDYLDIAKAEIEKLKKAVEIHKGIAGDWKYEAKKLKERLGEK